MRDLIVTQNITLDGVIDLADGWFTPDPGGGADVADLQEALTEQREAADAFLAGRVTFELMRSFWPHQTDDTTGVTEYLNRVEKYVVSTTLEDPAWDRSTILRGLDDVAALKAAPGADIVVTGSITLCHTLIGAGLVDEYRLFTYPAVQGRGRRLFPDGAAADRLRLVECRGFRNGVTYARYARG